MSPGAPQRFPFPSTSRLPMSPNTEGLERQWEAEPMRETPEVKNANSDGLPPSDNVAVSEAVWQKWLFFVGTCPVANCSKALGCASGAGEEQGAALLWKIATQRLKSEAESERA